MFVFFVIILYVSPGRSVVEHRVLYLGHSQIICRDVRVLFAALSVHTCLNMDIKLRVYSHTRPLTRLAPTHIHTLTSNPMLKHLFRMRIMFSSVCASVWIHFAFDPIHLSLSLKYKCRNVSYRYISLSPSLTLTLCIISELSRHLSSI